MKRKRIRKGFVKYKNLLKKGIMEKISEEMDKPLELKPIEIEEVNKEKGHDPYLPELSEVADEEEETLIDESIKELFDEFQEDVTHFATPVNSHPLEDIKGGNRRDEKVTDNDSTLRIIPNANFSSWLKGFIPKGLLMPKDKF